jgi:hypothetical protein
LSTTRAPLLALLVATNAAADPVTLTDVARAAGLGELTFIGSSWYGGGVAFVDLDGDSWPDLYFGAGQGEVDTLCHNRGDGTFSCGSAPGVSANANDVLAIAAGDVDGDGDLDLYLMRKGPNSLYRNDGGHFTDVTASTGTAGKAGALTPTGTFFDYDGDGRLDLYLGHWFASEVRPIAHDQVLRQQEDGTFVDVTAASGIDDRDRSSLAMIAFDYDRDGLQDLYVSGDFAGDLLFHNQGGGHFVDVTALQPPAFASAVTEGMGADVADIDGDGRPDLYVTGNNGNSDYGAALLAYQASGTFASLGATLGVNTGYSWGTGMVDLDNDGWVDIFVATDVADHYTIYLNQAGAGFVEQDVPGIEAGNNQCVTAAFADYDRDGRMDIVLQRIDGHHPQLLHNETGSANHWLEVRLVSPHDELGARVSVTTSAGTQEREILSQSSKGSQNDRRVHFGLAGATSADVAVRFADGTMVVAPAVAADRAVTIDRAGEVAGDLPPHNGGCAIGGRRAPAPTLLVACALALWLSRRRRRGA